MNGYSTFPASRKDVDALRQEPRSGKATKAALAMAMVMLTVTAVVVAFRSPRAEGSLRSSLNVAAIRDDHTYDPDKDAQSHEPHHKGNGPNTVYFHNEKSHGDDDKSYIASLAAEGAKVEDVTHGNHVQKVDNHKAVLEHRAAQDKRATFHAVRPSKDAPKFAEGSNIMDVLKQYETQVESATDHLEKLDHAEQTDSSAVKGNAEAVAAESSTVQSQIAGLHKELSAAEGKIDDVEAKIAHNGAVMSKLETVMEDVYYEEHDDHTKIDAVQQDELHTKYKAPNPWKVPESGAVADDLSQTDDDAYYYSEDDTKE